MIFKKKTKKVQQRRRSFLYSLQQRDDNATRRTHHAEAGPGHAAAHGAVADDEGALPLQNHLPGVRLLCCVYM